MPCLNEPNLPPLPHRQQRTRRHGTALIVGAHAARGRDVIAGDCGGSCDLGEGVATIACLIAGNPARIGSRFMAGIAPASVGIGRRSLSWTRATG